MTAATSGHNATTEPFDQLADVLEHFRPWADELSTADALQNWADTSGVQPPPTSWRPGWAFDLADHLRRIGAMDPDLKGKPCADFAWRMLGNLAAGRDALDDGSFAHIEGVPSRTRRRYVHDHGPRAETAWLDKWQRILDRAALVQAGRKPSTARRWLERHPDDHAAAAPPPRVR